MRHKYETRGIILARTPAGETNALLTILTPDFGLVRARAQGARRSGAKLAAALTTFSESELALVRGREQWRIVGAILKENWFLKLQNADTRRRAARVCGLVSRLVAGETNDALFETIHTFLEALAVLPEDLHEAAEMCAVLRVLAVLGLDAGEIENLTEVAKKRTEYIARINRDIEASGL